MSIWEPFTEWSGDGKLGQVTVSESETPEESQVEKSKTDRHLSLELGREIGAGDPPGKVKREWRTEP